jgi:hypothetical protein
LFGLGVLVFISLSFFGGFSLRILDYIKRREGADYLGVAVVVCAIAATWWLAINSGALLARYVFHLFPLRVSGRRRFGCVAVIMLGGPLLLISAVSIFTEDSAVEALRDAPHLVQLSHSTILLIPTIALGWLLLTLFRRYAFVPPHLRGGFLLFLRRFESFSDREVVKTVISASRGLLPVVFLVSKRRRFCDQWGIAWV